MTTLPTKEEIAFLRKLKHERRCRAELEYFADTVLKSRNPEYELSAAHKLLLSKLQAVADGKITKLMCFCPSGFGKSTLLSQIFPAWLLARQPGIKLIGASHNIDFAERKISRPIQDIMREFKSVLGTEPAVENAQDWHCTNRSTYRAAGVGSGILGERAHGAIVDDPFSGIAAAKSASTRETVYEWWRGDLQSRLYLGDASWKILMHQRLHLSDLAGRLLDEEGDEWDILYLPARFSGIDWRGNPIAEDELGRTVIGQSIWPEVWTDDALRKREAELGPQAWASMMQQRPLPMGGSTFLPARIKIVESEAELPKPKRLVLAFDFAAAKTKGDYTVGALLQENDPKIGGWTILDIARGQGGPDAMEKLILDTAEKHAAKYGRLGFKIFLPQDAAAAGAYMAQSLIKALVGYDVVSAREGGDKETRATPLATQVNAGNVAMIAAPWNRVLRDELEAFPYGTNDDIADACSSAFNQLIPEPTVYRAPAWGHYVAMGR